MLLEHANMGRVPEAVNLVKPAARNAACQQFSLWRQTPAIFYRYNIPVLVFHSCPCPILAWLCPKMTWSFLRCNA